MLYIYIYTCTLYYYTFFCLALVRLPWCCCPWSRISIRISMGRKVEKGFSGILGLLWLVRRGCADINVIMRVLLCSMYMMFPFRIGQWRRRSGWRSWPPTSSISFASQPKAGAIISLVSQTSQRSKMCLISISRISMRMFNSKKCSKCVFGFSISTLAESRIW